MYKDLKYINKLALLLPAFLALSACAQHTHVPNNVKSVRLPYVFQVESFHDMRQVEEEKSLSEMVDKRIKYSFDQDLMLKKLVRSINNRVLYSYDKALLRVRLKDYAAVRDGNLYSVAFYADMTGLNSQSQVLASGLYSCFASERLGIDFKGIFESVVSLDAPVKLEKREDKIWEKLYEQCLLDMAREFNSDVVYLDKGDR